MARDVAALGKDHRPRHVGRPPPQLAIHEIGEADEKDPRWSSRTGEVAERQEGYAALPGEQYDRKHAAKKAAVERHASFPHLHDLGWMLDEVAEVIEEHITRTAAQNDAERDPQDEVVEVRPSERGWAAPVTLVGDERPRVEPAEQNADDIRERVPADRERPEADQHRIELRIRNERKRHEEISPLGESRSGDAVQTAVASRATPTSGGGPLPSFVFLPHAYRALAVENAYGLAAKQRSLIIASEAGFHRLQFFSHQKMRVYGNDRRMQLLELARRSDV